MGPALCWWVQRYAGKSDEKESSGLKDAEKENCRPGLKAARRALAVKNT